MSELLDEYLYVITQLGGTIETMPSIVPELEEHVRESRRRVLLTKDMTETEWRDNLIEFNSRSKYFDAIGARGLVDRQNELLMEPEVSAHCYESLRKVCIDTLVQEMDEFLDTNFPKK